jgi:hypothetical protein
MKWTENPRMYVMEGQQEYRGQFKNWKPHGEGKMLMKKGRLVKGRFDKGVCGVDVCFVEFGQVSSSKGLQKNEKCHLF